MGASSGLVGFELQFGRSPIVMTGGIASLVPYGALPITSFIDTAIFPGGVAAQGDAGVSLDDFFAYFQAVPGGTMIDQQIGMYPFANQAVAANAVIQQPLSVSLLMICPAKAGNGYSSALSQMMAFQASLYAHNTSGGLYTIMTPKFIYDNCVMTAMTDVSTQSTHQVQWLYKLDFIKPLVTGAQAAQAQNALMSAISGGLPTDGAQTGIPATVPTSSPVIPSGLGFAVSP